MGSGKGGDDSGDDILAASELQVEFQREALEYLKETDALPQQFREGALTQLAGLYGVEGGEGQQVGQQDLIDKALSSPLYKAMMGGREAGEEAIARKYAGAGGSRSAGVDIDLSKYNTQLQNTALLESYNQEVAGQQRQVAGLQGLAGLPSLAPMIASGTAGIGTTLGQGQIAASQAGQQAQQQGKGNMMGMANLGLNAYEMFSDIRLKDNIRKIGTVLGHEWYAWEWNDEAGELGLYGSDEGVMAHDVYKEQPDIIGACKGYITVNYNLLEAA